MKTKHRVRRFALLYAPLAIIGVAVMWLSTTKWVPDVTYIAGFGLSFLAIIGAFGDIVTEVDHK